MQISFFSFLPPATTLRRYLRTTYSTTAAEIGQLYCDVVSFASDRSRPENEKIVKNLMAIRMKLKRSMALRENVAYEVCLGQVEGLLLAKLLTPIA